MARLPRLSKSQLEFMAKRLDGVRGANLIMDSLNAASNGQAETPESGLASLPPSRRNIANRSIQQTDSLFGDVASNEIGMQEQVELQKALNEAESKGRDGIAWSIVLGLLAFFLMTEKQKRNLYEIILSAYIDAYMLAIKEQAARHGCTSNTVKRPSGADLAKLERLAKRDAESIPDTYAREAQNELERLWRANPLGNLMYYIQGMQAWEARRGSRKSITIGIQNAQAGYQLGLEAFHIKNDLSSKYKFVGAAPVCKICVRLFGLGHVDFATMQSNPAPVHINCGHWWEEVSPKRIACNEIWVG